MSRNLILALVFAGSLAAIPLAEPRLPVEVEVRPGSISVTAGELETTLPVPGLSIRALRFSTPPAVLPVRWQDLSVTSGGGATTPLGAPRCSPPSGRLPVTADWWIDRKDATPGPPAEMPLAVSPPFTLRGELTGRTNGFARLDLVGERKLSFYFRLGLINGDVAVREGETVILHDFFYLDPLRSGRGIVTTFLFLLAGGSGLALALRLMARTPLSSVGAPLIERLASWVTAHASALTLVTVLASFAGTLWVAGNVLERTPHFQDDLGYLLRAKWMAAGRLTQPVDGLSPHLDIPFAVRRNGAWFIGYTVGWPAFLTFGQLLGVAWAVPALCGAISLWLVFLIGRTLHGPSAGLLATVLAALSPLESILFASPLSHAGTGMLVLLAVYFAVRSSPHLQDPSEGGSFSLRPICLSGLFLGLAFCCRPLTAVAIGVPVFVYLIISVVRSGERQRLRPVASFVLCGALGTLPVWIDNALTTGKPLLFGLELLDQGQRLSNWVYGLHWMDVSLAQLPPMLFGWLWRPQTAPALAFALAGAFLVPFLSRRAREGEWLLLAIFVSLVAAHLFHKSPGNHGYGPRYYAESLPFLHVLAAIGFIEAGGHSGDPSRRGALVPAVALCALLAGSALAAWPERMALYRGYNNVDASLVRAVRNAKIEDGVIVLDPQSYLQWVRAGDLLPSSWNDRLVVAGRARENSALYARYPGRDFYLWNRQSLIPLGTPETGRRIEDVPPTAYETVETLEPLLGEP